jgi:hypothetical protein
MKNNFIKYVYECKLQAIIIDLTFYNIINSSNHDSLSC